MPKKREREREGGREGVTHLRRTLEPQEKQFGEPQTITYTCLTCARGMAKAQTRRQVNKTGCIPQVQLTIANQCGCKARLCKIGWRRLGFSVWLMALVDLEPKGNT
jgi:hypothetical protein